jgi:hypothetical protein
MANKVEALHKLEDAAIIFMTAIADFGLVYDPTSVGLTEWIEGLQETLGEIKDDMDANIG